MGRGAYNVAMDSPPTPDTLAPWDFAGLLLTYACPARCAICYVHAGPEQGGWMPVETAVSLWRSLDALATAHGRTMRVHLAGGEPFSNWPRLVEIIRAAREAGLTPLEKVETNAFWATEDERVRSRLATLHELGMQKLVVSSDVFHQQFVPFERVRRCVEIGREVLGRERVRVRWWDFYADPTDTAALPAEERTAVFLDALARHPERLTGRAAATLAPRLPCGPAGAYAHENCEREVLHSRHVHIDPDGNIFPGTCAGIILGRATEAPADGSDRCPSGCNRSNVAGVWHTLAATWRQHPVVAPLATGGPGELLRRVVPLGYRERPDGYAGKCHLCADIRRWLVERGFWREWVGPPACYGLPTPITAAASR